MTERFRPYRKTKRKDQEFECLDCGINTLLIREYYMLTEEVWTSLFPSGDSCEGMLCISCVETRLGRVLRPEDFPKYPVNHSDRFRRSLLLQQRIKGTFSFMEK